MLVQRVRILDELTRVDFLFDFLLALTEEEELETARCVS